MRVGIFIIVSVFLFMSSCSSGGISESNQVRALNMGKCAEIPMQLTTLSVKAQHHFSENGKWPSGLTEFTSAPASQYWNYEIESDSNGFVLYAILKEGVTVGTMSAGEYVGVDETGRKTYSHSELKRYLKGYLAVATLEQ